MPMQIWVPTPEEKIREYCLREFQSSYINGLNKVKSPY